MFKKFLLCAVLGFSFQTLLPVKIQTGDGGEFPLTPFQKETLNSAAINNVPAGFADKDTRRFDFLDQDTFKLLLELIGPGDVFNVDRAKEILRGTSPAEFLPLLMGCNYLMVRNAALLEIIAEHYFAIQRDISWYDFVEHAKFSAAFFTNIPVAKQQLAQHQCLQTLSNPIFMSGDTEAFSLDGSMRATAESSDVKLWDARTGQWLQTFPGHEDRFLRKPRILTIVFSPDGSMLATGSNDDRVKLWDTRTGQCLQTLLMHENQLFSFTVHLAVAFSSDGSMLAAGSIDNTVKLWDASTGRCLQILSEHEEPIHSVIFSPDGRILATGSLNTAKLWDTCTGQCLQTISGHGGHIFSVAFLPDASILVPGPLDRTRPYLPSKLTELQQLFVWWAIQNSGKFRTCVSPDLDKFYYALPEQLQRKISTRTRSACSVM